jgi:polar amino acid transport system substrate-binding protein/cystine transport system substrate-binding protein/membrane-bound lytic murein transglycosylase F
VALVLALLFAVSRLPPDTALSEVREQGVLKACVPVDYPPLATPDADRPGIEIALLRDLAEQLELRLILNQNPSMGRDLNPRNWRLTRAQCQIIAGGVVASDMTRSYLETTIPHLEVGWAILDTGGDDLSGARVGVLLGLSGFDRIALARMLRGAGADVVVVNERDALEEGLKTGELDFAVTESLAARQIAENTGLRVRWLSAELDRLPIAFGLWKGELTLKRAVNDALETMQADGRTDAILTDYALAEIDADFPVSNPNDALPTGD